MLLAVLAFEGSGINVGAVSGMAQVNVRVDRQVKNRAEEALQLSGRSLPELIKKVVAKVAQGGGQLVGGLVKDHGARLALQPL